MAVKRKPKKAAAVTKGRTAPRTANFFGRRRAFQKPKPAEDAPDVDAPSKTVTAARTPDQPPILERERSSYDGDTAIKLYLREIGQVKLLTPQEEIELAARIKKGDKKAREQMIKANT